MQYTLAKNLLSKSYESLLRPPIGPGLPWMPIFTRCLGGLRPHEVTLLCAGTGTGKTSLIASIAAQLIQEDVPTFVAPVETGDVDFVTRVVCALSKKELNHGEPIPENVLDTAFADAIKIAESLLFIANYDNRVNIQELCSVLRFVSKEGAKIALLDNLNFFLDVVSADLEKAELDSAIHELVMLVKTLPLHIILIVHPRKTQNGRVESEFDIKGSSVAVQECANVCLFNRPKEEDARSPFDREIVFKKIRRRGAFVNQPFWIRYENARYAESR